MKIYGLDYILTFFNPQISLKHIKKISKVIIYFLINYTVKRSAKSLELRRLELRYLACKANVLPTKLKSLLNNHLVYIICFD